VADGSGSMEWVGDTLDLEGDLEGLADEGTGGGGDALVVARMG